MRSVTRFHCLLAALALPAAVSVTLGRAGPPPSRTVSFLREVRPILAQHCFQCHGPDEAARKAKLRLDLKDHGRGVFRDSTAWERLTAEGKRKMPPPGSGEPLSAKQLATLRAWIDQGAPWEEHWSLLPPARPPVPKVRAGWVRAPLDAFVLARLEREGLTPEPEATRHAWLRRVSFDLTGLPPTPAELDDFLKDATPTAYEKQVDRLLKSPRYGERQAQEWLDLARYADTSGYQNDTPRQVWKWREWVINAYNANLPFDRFTIEQLAGDLLPNATLAQRVATGFNRNHPTNSEAGEEEDEYRSAYVIDRVNTTATVFMGLTMACAQCHDHKYDPISQRDFYFFYAFFNNIKERDSDYMNPRPSIPVPNPDQEPRLADLKARIAALQRRLDRDDALTDAEQHAWEKRALGGLGKPIEWTTARPEALLSRNGSVLQVLDDGSVLSTGPTPVKDTYDVMLRPGKKNIAALRIEVLPDDRNPLGSSGRSEVGTFHLSAIEVRHANLADSQESPLVYLSRGEADVTQKPKEDFGDFDMFPGAIDSALVVEPVGSPGGFFFGGGWSLVGPARRQRHEAILLPLEPIETNEASVLRISLHQAGGRKFRSLIGRFRVSYTEDARVRELMLPAQPKLWSALGPFPAADSPKAYSTAFEPEKDVKKGPVDLLKTYDKVVLPPPEKLGPPKVDAPAKGKEKAPAPKAEVKETPKAKPQKIGWAEQRTWRDGQPARVPGGAGAYYLTRKVVSTRARTALVRLDGLAGYKLWLNGEPVQAQVPAPATKDAKPEADAFVAMQSRPQPENRFRLGLRQGENEIVLKAIVAGGDPFTFRLTPEGDDVVSHEVATALRQQAAPDAGDRTKGPATVVQPPEPSGPKKVSLVGEKSAPPKPEENDPLTPAERRRKVIRDYYRSHIDPLGRLVADELAKLKAEEQQLKRQMPETLVMEETDKPRPAFIFLRGLYKNRGEAVTAGTPRALPPLAKDEPANRLGLARWLVSPRHPLTARVLVNRIWQQYFGLGLVRTAEDFGIRGELPTHPELLDYLACEVMDGWDLKRLHKRIVLSATYRQAATAAKEKLDRDPENRLLARGPRVRLSAEMVRDNALAVSGLLVEKVGGESVRPVLPGPPVEDGFGRPYQPDRDERQYRRGLYVHWQRGSPYPSMQNFDLAKRDACTVTRAATTTPLQALTLLNDLAFVECARLLGQRMLKDREAVGRARDLTAAEQDDRRLAYGFRLCTSRPPTEREADVLRKLLDDQRGHYKANAAEAKKLLGVGDAKADEALDAAELAAWATVGNALLNLDATIHR